MIAPISVASSSGSPIVIASTLPLSLWTKLSWIESCTKIREAAVQLWPCRVKRMPATAPATALSISASPMTIIGLLPPSSSVTGMSLSAAAWYTIFPVSTEPVKVTLPTPLWATSGAPQPGPSPVNRLKRPGGSTWFMIWQARKAASGASSAALTMTALPATRAGAILSAISMTGTFHGMMAPTTPVAGLITGKRRPDNAGRKAPSISNRFESSRANWCGSRLVDTRFSSMALPFARSKAEFVQDGGAVAVEIGRRKPRRRVGEGRELHRIACETHGLARCNDRLDQHVARGHLRVCQGLRDVVDRPARNAGLAEDLDPGSGRLAAEDPVELAAQLGVVGVAQIVRREARVGRQVVAPECDAQFEPQPVIAGGDDDVPVRRRKRLEGGDRRVARSHRSGDLAGRRVAHDRVLEQRELAVENGDVDLGRLAAPLAMVERGIDGDRRIEPGAEVADRGADAGRRRARMAGDAHDAAEALDDHVVGGLSGRRAGMAEARRRRIDQPRKAPVQALPAIAELLHRAGTEILDDDIGAREQRVEDALVRLVLEIDGDRFLAAVDRH